MKPLLSVVALCGVALPAGAVPVSIQVVGPDGNPLATARLSLVETEGLARKDLTVDEPVGPNGSLSFEWDGEFEGEDKSLWVRARAPGMAIETRKISAPATTMRLQKGRNWGGIVWDENERPLAGVPVVIARWEADSSADDQTSNFHAMLPAWKLRAVTDAAGRWQIDGLPARAVVRVGFDDARFVRKPWELLATDDAEPLLIARLGATITGQIVAPDGAPLANWRMLTLQQDSTFTDEQGRFTLSGLAPGTTMVYAFAQTETPPDFLLPERRNVETKAATVTDLGVWKADSGVFLTMRALDEQTKKPLSDAHFDGWQADNALADDAGKIALRLLPDQINNAEMALGMLLAPGHVAHNIEIPGAKKFANPIELGDIALKRGAAITGAVTVQNEDATAHLPLPALMLFHKGLTRDLIYFWRDQRQFTTQVLEPGVYQLRLSQNHKTASDDWQIVAPQTVTVPDATDDKPVSIAVVMKRLTPAPTPLREVRGQLRDANGEAVAGALVTLRLSGDNDTDYRSAISDIDGNFVADGAPGATIVELENIERAGYLRTGIAQTVIEDGVATVSGVTLRKRGKVFAGRVLNQNAQPVVGAWVAALEMPGVEPVQTRADGTFELVDLPLDNFALVAAKDLDFARIETRVDAADVELTLQTPAVADREALANQVLQGAADWWDLKPYREILGLERSAQMVARQDKTQESSLELFALELAGDNPAEFARRAPAWLPLLENDSRARVEAELFRVRAATGSADDKIEVNNWLDERKTGKRAVNADSVTQLLQLAAVARALERADADDLLDFAAAIAAQGGKADVDQLYFWAIPLSRLGYPSIEHFVDGAKPAAEFETLLVCTYLLAQCGDLESARRAIERAAVLAKTPEMLANLPDDPHQRPAAHIDDVRKELALVQADSDAAGAFALINQIEADWMKTPVLLVIADRAIGQGDLQLAERTLRQVQTESAKNRLYDETTGPRIASLGQRISPQLGAELWVAAQPQPIDADNPNIPRPTGAWWAFYHAPFDAAQSRVKIEIEWSWRLPAAIEDQDDEYSYHRDALRHLTVAMVVIDPNRALEMRDEAQKRAKLADAADLALGAALLATPAQRARFGIN